MTPCDAVDTFKENSTDRYVGNRDDFRDGRRVADYRPTRDNWGPITVPYASYFVMGDNRDNSEDSRYWGFVPEGSIKGRPWIIYFSYDRNKIAPFPWLTEIRWSRLFDAIG